MPELPEVETMVRGLRPALAGPVRRADRGSRSVPAPGLRRAGVRAARDAGCEVAEVGRRGKWVVIALADHRGIIVIQPRMTGGFWLVEPASTRPHPPDVPPGETRAMVWYCDTRRLGKIDWFASPERGRRGVRPVARARCPGDRLDDLAARLRRTAPGHQADAHGPEGAGGHRQHLRRRDPLRRRGSTPSESPRGSSRDELDRLHRGDRRRSWPRRSPPRGPASTPAIARSWAWKAASWPRTPCTAARASPAAPAASRSRRRRSPA